MKDARKGEKPKNRKLATKVRSQAKKGKLTANQWQNTPQQHQMMTYWLDPKSDTFGNAYDSAIKAGYSPYYANQITSPAVGNKWIQEYKRRLILGEEHIIAAIQDLAMNAPNSKSPDDTRTKNLELLAKIKGLIDNKHQTNVTLVQPILSGKSVKQVDVEVTDK